MSKTRVQTEGEELAAHQHSTMFVRSVSKKVDIGLLLQTPKKRKKVKMSKESPFGVKGGSPFDEYTFNSIETVKKKPRKEVGASHNESRELREKNIWPNLNEPVKSVEYQSKNLKKTTTFCV